MNSINYLEVSFCQLQTVISVGTFDGTTSLAGQVLGVASVLLSKSQEGVDGLLVCIVSAWSVDNQKLLHIQSEWPWISTTIFFKR